MQRSLAGTLIALVVALVVAALTIYLSLTRLKEPQIPLDWVALVFSGLTTGIITFFITWGHFQKEPVPPSGGPNGTKQ